MKSIAEILDDLRHIDVGVKCRQCGAVPMLVGKQYSVRCPSCGIMITCTPKYLVGLKEAEFKARNPGTYKRNLCNICEDTGVVFITEQIDGQLQEFGYRCLCRTGATKDDIAAWPVVPAAKIAARGAILQGQEVDIDF